MKQVCYCRNKFLVNTIESNLDELDELSDDEVSESDSLSEDDGEDVVEEELSSQSDKELDEYPEEVDDEEDLVRFLFS